MNDVNMISGQQFDVAGRQQVDVNGQQIFAERVVAGKVRDGRAEAAIGVVAFIALEPVEHFAARAHEHFKFLFRFRDVRGDPPVFFARDSGA